MTEMNRSRAKPSRLMALFSLFLFALFLSDGLGTAIHANHTGDTKHYIGSALALLTAIGFLVVACRALLVRKADSSAGTQADGKNTNHSNRLSLMVVLAFSFLILTGSILGLVKVDENSDWTQLLLSICLITISTVFIIWTLIDLRR